MAVLASQFDRLKPLSRPFSLLFPFPYVYRRPLLLWGFGYLCYRLAGSSVFVSNDLQPLTIDMWSSHHTPAYPVQIDAVRDREFSIQQYRRERKSPHTYCWQRAKICTRSALVHVHAFINFIIHRKLSVVADSDDWFMSFDIISSDAAVLLVDTCGIFFCHLPLLHDGSLGGG